MPQGSSAVRPTNGLYLYLLLETWCVLFSFSYQEWKSEFSATVALHCLKRIAWNQFYVQWYSKRLYGILLMLFTITNFLFKLWPHLVIKKMKLQVFCDVTLFWVSSAFMISWTTSAATHCHNYKTSVFSNTTVRHSDLPGSHELLRKNGRGCLPQVGNNQISFVPRTPFSWC